MEKKIYLSCEKAKKELFKKRILNNTENVVIVENIHEADTCLVIGQQTNKMKQDISISEEYGIDVKEVEENLINTGVYQSILDGHIKPKSYSKHRGMEL